MKTPGNADQYPALKITWISGKSPILIIKEDDGKAIEQIDLANMKNSEIHTLLSKKGLQRIVKVKQYFR